MYALRKNKTIKKVLIVISVAAFGLICFGIGFAYNNYIHKVKQNDDSYPFSLFSSVTFEGVQKTDDNPWNYSAGIFDMDQEECILLTPNTSVILAGDNALPSWTFQYRIHPWVAEKSDGAGLIIWILDKDENIIFSDEIYVNAEDQWQNYFIDTSSYENAAVIKILCNNGDANNDECDWIVLKAQSNGNSIFANHYVKSATYFADEWPINFWNSEMDYLESDLLRVKADGFDSIIIVIPWREFQPTIFPITYNEYAFIKLNELMSAASKIGLKVYTRLGYIWDFYNDRTENIVDRYFNLLGDPDTIAAWDDYILKMYHVLSKYDCFANAFLTWEDFWGSMGICAVEDINERITKSSYIKYNEWVRAHYSLNDYNQNFKTEYTSYDEIPIPHNSEPALWAMYEFYDDFLIDILKRSQQNFPNLSMEVRMDWDLVMDKEGMPIYYKHDKTYSCASSNFSTTMYGIPMGFENKGERVSYNDALEKTEYILQNFKEVVNGKTVYIDQFIFADNTPKFSNNAQIKEEQLNDYLLNLTEILQKYSGGYGIWTYRNYRANMIYNSQFALGENGWEGSNIDFYENNDTMVCHISPTGYISQIIPDIRNHFNSNNYILEFDVVELALPGMLEIQVGDTVLNKEIIATGKVQIDIENPGYFNINMTSVNTDIVIDNIKLYSQIQQGYLYDENFDELNCIEAIRLLNSSLNTE